MRQRSKLHWSKVVCRPWAIVVYNVEPTLGQRRNAIWVVDPVCPFFLGLHTIPCTKLFLITLLLVYLVYQFFSVIHLLPYTWYVLNFSNYAATCQPGMPNFSWITSSSVDLVCANFCGPGMQSIFPITLLLLLYAFFHYSHLLIRVKKAQLPYHLDWFVPQIHMSVE